MPSILSSKGFALTRVAAALGLGLTLAVGSSGVAQAQPNMRSSISIGQNSHQGVGVDVFAREVEKRTGGRYKI